jgi:hypothetical protein
VLIVVFVAFNGVLIWVACSGPGPAAYNVITGEGAFRPCHSGPIWSNISAGLNTGLGLALIGLSNAGPVKLARLSVAGLRLVLVHR